MSSMTTKREGGREGRRAYLEQAEEDVCVDSAFVGLVEHHHGVTGQVAIHEVFTQKHAV